MLLEGNEKETEEILVGLGRPNIRARGHIFAPNQGNLVSFGNVPEERFHRLLAIGRGSKPVIGLKR